MAGPVSQFKVGMVEFAKWQGTYKEQTTFSFSLKKKKFNEETKTFDESPFLTVTDLKDIMIGTQKMLMDHYMDKNNQGTAKPKDECPF